MTIDDALAGRFPKRVRTLVRDLEAMSALVQDIDGIWLDGAQDKRNVIFLAPRLHELMLQVESASDSTAGG